MTRLSTAQKATLIASIFVIALVPPPLGAEEIDPARLTLERIFGEDAVETERFGPARWLADGSGYTTLEPSPDFEEVKDEDKK